MFAYRIAFKGAIHCSCAEDGLGYFKSHPDFMEAARLFKNLKWDGTIGMDVRELAYYIGAVYIPNFPDFVRGYILQDLMGVTYLASPVEFPWIRDRLDYDAYTDSEEVQRAVGMILDEHGDEIFGRELISWSRSRAGNPTAFHNGVTITVFPDKREGGYKTVLTLSNEKKNWLPRKKTELKAMKYVTDNFRRICAETNQSNNPFIRWPDADELAEYEDNLPEPDGPV